MIQWSVNEVKYSNGYLGYLGRFVMFEFHWNDIRDTNKKWSLTCFLPGIKKNLGDFEKEDEAKKRAEEVLCLWLDNTGLTRKRR